jgi:hypothetical protein
MARSIRIDVMAADIAEGVVESCRQCPIARAISRAIPAAVRIAVTGLEVEIGLRTNVQRLAEYRIELPTRAQAFVRLFDRHQPVRPFSFDLPLPPEWP